MPDQIALWKEEHANFHRLLDLVDAEVRVFHEGGRPDYDLMVDILYYLIHYPDRFHHPRENVAIVRLLRKAPDCRSCAAAFNHEHEVIARSGTLLLEQLQAVVAGAVMPRAAVEGTAATYSAYYRRHMTHEEEELFPSVERLLTPEDWAAVEKAIPLERDPLFGDHPEKRYAALYCQIVNSRPLRQYDDRPDERRQAGAQARNPDLAQDGVRARPAPCARRSKSPDPRHP